MGFVSRKKSERPELAALLSALHVKGVLSVDDLESVRCTADLVRLLDRRKVLSFDEYNRSYNEVNEVLRVALKALKGEITTASLVESVAPHQERFPTLVKFLVGLSSQPRRAA